MLHAERKPRYFESQDVSETEPCSKRIKSVDEPYGKSYDALQRLHEEVHITKTHSGFIPLSLSDDYDDCDTETTRQQERETAVLDPFNRAVAKTEPSNSLSNTEVTGSKCHLSTDNAGVYNKQNNVVQKDKNEGDTELYSTSKAFIGPIYKTEADCQHDERNWSIDYSCQNVSNAKFAGKSKKMPPQQALPCHVPKIEDELSQFYSEIDQLESNENCLDDNLQETETNSHGQPVEYNKPDRSFSVNSQEWPCRTPPSWNNGQCSFTSPDVHYTGHEQYPSSDPTICRNSNRQCYNSPQTIWETKQLCNKQEGSRFWNNSMPEFKPGWQHTHPFITPYGSPSPQYIPHFNLQEPSSSFHSAIFCPPNAGPFKNVPINMNSSADQNSEYTSYFGTHCAQTSRNGYNVPDRLAVNGFCETQTNRKDVKTCWTEGLSTGSQQFSKNRLCESQKFLILLRGLPGSGKTTLSHVLLGRDGIVFSTDDYFCQNNGCWSYNIAQLGAAHDWNQKRAKQAMDQGRSPVIIDNTNTQAWEMKPYVEAALEKGYQVEFHEPDTWWKFNPEELEKRNKHGVSREKIVQMLERYEYHMSVPIVMNSVLPFHKTSQRPPPQRRQRESVVKKPHRFYKTKKKRKRKRNKKMKAVATKAIGKRSDVDFSPSDDDSSWSGQEDLEDNGKSAFVTGYPTEHKKESVDGFAEDSGLKYSELQNGTFLDSSMMDSVASGHSLNTNGLAKDSNLSLMNLPSVTDKNVAEQSFQLHGTQRLNFVKSDSSILEYNNQSTLKLSNSGTDNCTSVGSAGDKDKAAGVVLKQGVESSLLSHREEVTVFQHKASHNIEMNSWAFFSIDTLKKQQEAYSDENKCLPWPEVLQVIMYEQIPKKERRSKQNFSKITKELSDFKSSKISVEQEDGKMLLEKSDIRHYAVPSLLMENTCAMSCIAVGDFPTESRTKASIPSDATMLASPRKNRRCKRIFKLAPNFDFPRQIAVKNDKEIIKEVGILMKQEGISNKETITKKASLGCYGFSAQFSYDTVNIQMSTSASGKASSPGEQQIVPLNQIMETNTEEKQDKIPPDVSTMQPDILCSIKEISGCLIDSAVKTLESIQQFNETEQTAHSQIRDYQNPLSTNSKFLRLPLSLRFAVQLTELFGSPGVPLDTLLPDDYVVPLDWATSKHIYLHWKTSVEKKHKNNISKEDCALSAGVTTLEDSNKGGQES
nr:NEDD4-binding protein 2-like 2 [Pogona vitticeps]XP_020644299.1 NEDD4-binding protein 2-like 2 [Pogona vitticeps]